MKLFQKTGAFRALSYPNYFWFWSSYFVSNVGSWMQGIAQGWLLFDLTSSPFYLGLFSSLRMVMLLSFLSSAASCRIGSIDEKSCSPFNGFPL